MADVILSWKDENIIEQGYRIYRGTDPDVVSNGEMISTQQRGQRQFYDTSLISGNTYYYCVASFIKEYELYSDVIEVVAQDDTETFVYVADKGGVLTCYALDGTVVWQYHNPFPILSLVVDANSIAYIGREDGYVTIVDSEGTVVKSIDTGYPVNAVSLLRKIEPDIIVVGSSSQPNPVAIDIESGEALWTYSGDNIAIGEGRHRIALDEDYVFALGTGDGLHKMTIDNGTGLNISTLPLSNSSSIFLDTVDKRIYVSSHSHGDIRCLDYDGNEIWKKVLHSSSDGPAYIYFNGVYVFAVGYGIATVIDKLGNTVMEYSLANNPDRVDILGTENNNMILVHKNKIQFMDKSGSVLWQKSHTEEIVGVSTAMPAVAQENIYAIGSWRNY